MIQIYFEKYYLVAEHSLILHFEDAVENYTLTLAMHKSIIFSKIMFIFIKLLVCFFYEFDYNQKKEDKNMKIHLDMVK
jgi:hypothetical protein